MAREYMAVPVQWKASDDGDSNVLMGYASTFGNVDLHGDVVRKGAFKKTIRERVKVGRVKLLDSHVPDSSHVIGTVAEAKEDEHGLAIKARLSSAPSVQDLKTKLLEGHLEYLSIGYTPVKQSFHRNDDDEVVRHLDEVALFEVSVVPFPANEEAAISAVKEAIRVAGSGLVEAPMAERKALAEELSDALGDVFDQPVALVVGSTSEQVKSALGVEPDETSDETPEASTETSGDEDGDEDGDREAPEHAAKQELPDPDDDPDDEPTGEKPSLDEIMRRSRALLGDRDPDEMAEPPQVAALTTRLDLEERRLQEITQDTDLEEVI